MEGRPKRKKASDFPQELLNLLDGYVHGGLSRRQFLDRAQKFAVGGVTAMALFEMLRPNYAWAIQVQPDDKRIKTSTESVPSPQGYGTQPKARDVAKIKAPINAQYGELDNRVTDGWPAFDAALTEAKVPHEGHVYKGANHGFHNDTTPRYDEAAAKEAWQHTLDWFNKYLRDEPKRA